MKLIIKVSEKGKRVRVLETPLTGLSLSDLRELHAAEAVLNRLPGTQLRFHFDIVEEEK